MGAFETTYFSGERLYGDDFSPEQIAAWFADEENGYYGLIQAQDQEYSYGYALVNEIAAYRYLRRRRYETCVALGCANGGDVAPLASVVGRFIGVEPAKSWWSSEIGGKPAAYHSPSPLGDLPLENSSADLAVAISVLHHIPNVSHTIAEVARVLRPGGVFALREPIHSMGDWRKPRMGLTKNERGLSRAWLYKALREAGFEIERARPCLFPALYAILKRAGVKRPVANWPAAWADAALSALFSGNENYLRDSVWKKLAPGQVFIVARKI